MNSNLLTVSNSEFGKLEILVENGKELFPATECAKILGYANANQAIHKNCRSLSKRTVPHPQNPEKHVIANFISEGDLWRLIIRSRLPAAQKFEKWLFDEVLPELRRTGGYRAKPSADLPHQWMGRGCIRIDDAAKVLGVKKDKIRELLNKRKTVYRNGVDWETLHGYEVDEYKFYNRVPTAAKGICIVYDSGMAKLRWELLGEGSPDMALPAAAEVPLLPAAVQEENEQLRFALEEIGKIAGKLGK
ncbi:Bro-N domain-containing protein [Agathobaculum butyriciproducens]|uniref:BRO-N domain-containing protein n=1 Tax=Agathobaculum butyriciproducens TaxID=1628085 RepID=UPI003A8D97D9